MGSDWVFAFVFSLKAVEYYRQYVCVVYYSRVCVVYYRQYNKERDPVSRHCSQQNTTLQGNRNQKE